MSCCASRRPSDDEIAALPPSALVISYLRPLDQPELVQALAERGVSALAMELVPRITRAQTMDALSSQANIAGYRAVLVASTHLPRYFPLLMTAAGTVPPAKVLVLGAGVAGLQAIATARRLGAVVSAFDVRPAVREQVESLGATFLEVELPEAGREPAAATRKELSQDTQRLQRELLAEHVAGSDVVITTALVPGRPAPQLIGADMVASMRPGSVIVDLAAEAGGNCELTVPGETVVRENVTIVGDRNPAAAMPYDASRLYARNVTELLGVCLHEGRVALVRGRRRDRRLPRLPRRRRRPPRRPGAPRVNSPADPRADRARPRRVRRLRGHLEGADDAAHAADVGHERDPRHRDRRRHPRRRRRRQRLRDGARPDRRRFGAINVVGGFVVTDRMLQMFKRKDDSLSRSEAIQLIDLLAIIAFVVGLKRLSHPATARSGNTHRRGRHAGRRRGHALADEGVVSYWAIAVAIVDRLRHRRALGARREDDRDAADGRALQRRRRRRRGPDRARGVPPPRARSPARPPLAETIAIALSLVIGCVSFAGSLIAFAKLQELIGGRPVTYPAQKPDQRADRAPPS